MKRHLWLLAAAFFLPSCQTASTPESVLNSYLNALRSGDRQLQSELACLMELPSVEHPLSNLTDVKSWEIVEHVQTSDDGDPDSQYALISARIESVAAGGFLVTQTWRFDVWDSDEFFEFQKRSAAQLNQHTVKINEHEKRIRALLGEPAEDEKLEMWVPDRSKIASYPYCLGTGMPAQL